MKFEDLHDVEIGDILTCKDLDVTFKMIDVDIAASDTPILVELLSGNSTGLVSGVLSSDRFDEFNNQWLYASVEALRKHIPYCDDVIDVSKLITLDRLEPLVDVNEPDFENLKELTEPEESEEFEAITASQAAELSKRKILRELMDRIRKAISSNFGVFELKVPDLDLDPVTPELEVLGYVVRFSMQDDEFTISWEPKL